MSMTSCTDLDTTEGVLMKQFIVDDSFWQIFPMAQLGVVVATGLKTPHELMRIKRLYIACLFTPTLKQKHG